MSESVFTTGSLKRAMYAGSKSAEVRGEVHNYEPAKTRNDSEKTRGVLVGPFHVRKGLIS